MGGNSSKRNKKLTTIYISMKLHYEFNSVIVWWMIWCPIYNMGYMKNKQNNEFSHFFFIDDIFYMIIRLQT